MLSKNKIKLIHSLEKKKYRTEEGLFVAEGPKLIEELVCVWKPVYVAATEEWLATHTDLEFDTSGSIPSCLQERCDVVTQNELEKISLVRTPQQVLALFRLPKEEAELHRIASESLCLALDGVQDPGNVGTIIRLADWFGIKHVFCSFDTADIYSPKCIQSTMGAIARVRVHYINLSDALKQCESPIYGTHLDGEDIYKQSLTAHGVIVMGNEGKGVSPEVGALVSSRLFIPPYPVGNNKVESLNVAIATAIVCAEFRRRQ